jgi:lysozyme family protein
VPYLDVNNGAWQQASTVAVNVGDTVKLAGQNISGGTWSWTGPNGFTATTREVDAVPLNSATNVYTLTYTNTAGVASNPQTFTITINPTAIVPYIQVNGGAWQQTASASVQVTDTVNLAGLQQNGGTWSWTGPNGFTSTSREIDAVPLVTGTNAYTATYTNVDGVASTQVFSITAN